jgi:hypothetical protein
LRNTEVVIRVYKYCTSYIAYAIWIIAISVDKSI